MPRDTPFISFSDWCRQHGYSDTMSDNVVIPTEELVGEEIDMDLGDLGEMEEINLDDILRPFKLTKEHKTKQKKEIKIDNSNPMRFGVEMEFESNEYVNWDNLFNKISKKDLDIGTIDEDGSLSDYGFEIISKPLKNINDLYDFMTKTREVVVTEVGDDLYEGPTCAIHIHVSNIKNVANLFSLCTYFRNEFDKIRLNHNNNLVHRFSRWPAPSVIKKAKKIDESYIRKSFDYFSLKDFRLRELNPEFVAKSVLLADHFMGSRRCTLRYSGWDSHNNTLEFRIFPHKYNDELYKIYCRIVGKFIEKAEEGMDGDAYDTLVSMDEHPKERLEHFKKIVGLTDDQMELLFGRFLTLFENPQSPPRSVSFDENRGSRDPNNVPVIPIRDRLELPPELFDYYIQRMSEYGEDPFLGLEENEYHYNILTYPNNDSVFVSRLGNRLVFYHIDGFVEARDNGGTRHTLQEFIPKYIIKEVIVDGNNVILKFFGPIHTRLISKEYLNRMGLTSGWASTNCQSVYVLERP